MLKKFLHIYQISNFQKGFTLIELIVAIAILSILSVFVIATLNPYEQYQKAQDARRKSDLNQIQKALEAYYQDNGRYPASTTTTDASCYYCIKTSESSPGNVKKWGESWGQYIQILPKDSGSRRYVYYADTDGQSYWLYASLQRGAKDAQVCNSGGVCSNASTISVVCGTVTTFICNYGVSSTNVSP